jgi:hypothetical protein
MPVNSDSGFAFFYLTEIIVILSKQTFFIKKLKNPIASIASMPGSIRVTNLAGDKNEAK